ncbi:MFS transporter [Cohnella panacarvi]|uniref:MFS transporter n=1 Tax=Cohnella panacarvi TaxID=400776 RepID=UPI000478B3E5|nr:MFS transporter [Cohnella panacarvi]
MANTEEQRSLIPILITLLGFFMAILDTTIVNVSLPRISEYYHADMERASWVVDAYTLVFGVLLLTASRLADQFGRRKWFQIGLVIFTVSSLLCGFASTAEQLIAFRILQAFGAAIIVPVVIPIVVSHLPNDKLGKVTAIFGGVAGLASALGPVLGGILSDTIGWQWIFLINIPVGVLAFVLGRVYIQESVDPTAGRKIDWAGILTLSASLLSVTFGLLKANAYGWSSPIILGLIAGAAVSMTLFILIEARSAHPMVPLSLFRNFSFSSGNVAFFLFGVGHMGGLFMLSFYMVDLIGMSSLRAGLLLSTMAVCALFVSPVVGVLVNKHGTRWFSVCGFLAFGIGMYLLSGLTMSADSFDFIWRLAILGVGISLIMPSLSLSLVLQVPEDKVGMSSGIYNTMRTFGMALGIAILVALLTQFTAIEANVADGSSHAFSKIFRTTSLFLFAGAVFAWFNGIRSAEYRLLVQGKQFGVTDPA